MEDLDSVVELDTACLRVDGGLPFLFSPEVIASRYFPGGSGSGIGGYTMDGHIVACTTVYMTRETNIPNLIITGQVHPDLRNQGLGSYLMHWSQAGVLQTGASGPAPVLQIRTESWTEPAHHLYTAHGFECVEESLVMERDLCQPLPVRLLPEGMTIASWRPELAEQFYEAYHVAFLDRPGFPGWSSSEWIGHVTDNDLVAEWSLLALAGNDPAGFVIGNIDLTSTPAGGFIWQIGVLPAQRMRGLASALLVECMQRMNTSGCHSALLTVHTNNPGAIQAYAQLGFTTIGRRARYEKK